MQIRHYPKGNTSKKDIDQAIDYVYETIDSRDELRKTGGNTLEELTVKMKAMIREALINIDTDIFTSKEFIKINKHQTP